MYSIYNTGVSNRQQPIKTLTAGIILWSTHLANYILASKRQALKIRYMRAFRILKLERRSVNREISRRRSFFATRLFPVNAANLVFLSISRRNDWKRATKCKLYYILRRMRLDWNVSWLRFLTIKQIARAWSISKAKSTFVIWKFRSTKLIWKMFL